MTQKICDVCETRVAQDWVDYAGMILAVCKVCLENKPKDAKITYQVRLDAYTQPAEVDR